MAAMGASNCHTGHSFTRIGGLGMTAAHPVKPPRGRLAVLLTRPVHREFFNGAVWIRVPDDVAFGILYRVVWIHIARAGMRAGLAVRIGNLIRTFFHGLLLQGACHAVGGGI